MPLSSIKPISHHSWSPPLSQYFVWSRSLDLGLSGAGGGRCLCQEKFFQSFIIYFFKTNFTIAYTIEERFHVWGNNEAHKGWASPKLGSPMYQTVTTSIEAITVLLLSSSSLCLGPSALNRCLNIGNSLENRMVCLDLLGSTSFIAITSSLYTSNLHVTD